ncbi:hypothetical protein [Pseudoalteromonas maricaloris]|uniref:hypothetical protein n=1 Tax=Pseudoalteromonas maricaloris TaxID=184924 RepID=UPI003C282C7B
MNSLAEKFSLLGKALTQNAEAVARLTELNGEEESDLGELTRLFNTLTSYNIVHGNEVEGFSASSVLVELSYLLNKQEANRRLSPDVNEWLAQLQLKISQLNQAKESKNPRTYGQYLTDIRGMVFLMRDGINNEVRAIEIALHTKFGHVESIADKQAENKYLINRLERLTNKLLVLDLQTLNDLAGSNPELRKILSVKLFHSVDECREAILASIPRLKHLLWEFEKQSRDSKRIWAFYNHFRTHSQGFKYAPTEEELKELVLPCYAENHTKELAIDIENQSNISFHSELLNSLKPRHQQSFEETQESKTPSIFDGEANSEDKIEYSDKMESHLIEMLRLSKLERVSCREYWASNLSESGYPCGFMSYAYKELIQIKSLSSKRKLTVKTIQAFEQSATVSVTDLILEPLR